MVDTSNDWILERTGITTRHIADSGVATSDMAVEAARQALDSRGIDASTLDAILVCTVTPDMMFPSTACLVQTRLGAAGAWGFDLVAACSGFVYGLTTAAHLEMSGTHQRVLVIGADTMPRIIDYTDRATCVLFGDGAGAMLVEAGDPVPDAAGFIGFHTRSDGSGGDVSRCPPAAAAARVAGDRPRPPPLRQAGRARLSSVRGEKMEERAARCWNGTTSPLHDVVLIPHQATAASSPLPPTGSASTASASSSISSTTATPPRRPFRWPPATPSPPASSTRATWCCSPPSAPATP
jgi:3-oxoacyl-[acyl-carrier-protein] synthase-3